MKRYQFGNNDYIEHNEQGSTVCGTIAHKLYFASQKIARDTHHKQPEFALHVLADMILVVMAEKASQLQAA